MRINASRAVAGLGPSSGEHGLPPALAFLQCFSIPSGVLLRAATQARERGCGARSALLASGAVSETCYHLCLARHLGVPFVMDWPRLSPDADLRRAIVTEHVRLAQPSDAEWLIAPSDRDIDVLIAAHRGGHAAPPIAITTPSHFKRLVHHRAGARIAYEASDALPDRRPKLSARDALPGRVLALVGLMIILVLFGELAGSNGQAILLGALFLGSTAFRLLVVASALVRCGEPDLPTPNDAALPTYSVLVPLHDEAGMVDDLVRALERLNYPRARLEVLFLVEMDDHTTRAALARHRLGAGFRVIEVPEGAPRTKPRALNVGLLVAQGELITVFDAEDRPEQNQLRLAAARFLSESDELACLQASLAIGAGDRGLLSRLFAIEYALLFDLLNRGLAKWRLPIPLGGTSNHFRASVLRAVDGWDAWNVTEDADLGFRLARLGYGIGMLPSSTWEEAPTRVRVWYNQRRRWMKGWMQTLAVLARDAPAVAGELGCRRTAAMTLMLTSLVTGPLLTPIVLVPLAWRLARHGLPMPDGLISWAAATLSFAVLAIGIVGTLWSGWIGARSRCLATPLALAAFLPYQLLICLAAWGGLVDLATRPFHWRKTPHGAAALDVGDSSADAEASARR